MAAPIPSTESRYAPVLFAGLLSLVAGMLLAAASLIAEPVRELSAPLREGQAEAGKVYFLKGRDAARSQTWAPQLDAILAGQAGTLSLEESDLNNWARTRLAPPVAMRQADEETPPPRFLLRQMERLPVPNFRIADGRLQVAVTLPSPLTLGGGATVLYQAHGSFSAAEGENEPPVFLLHRTNFGQLPVGFLFTPAEDRLFNEVLRLFGETDAFRAIGGIWPRLESAEIVDDRLHLRFRADLSEP